VDTRDGSEVTAERSEARFRLDGRVAVVTGASSGLGARFARVLHAAGAAVAVSARRAERLEELVAGRQRMSAHPGDVGVPEQVDELVRNVLGLYGRIDVVVNNAGTSDAADALRQEDGDFERVLGVNLAAPYRVSRQAARAMIERELPCTIVNVASILGLRGSAVAAQAGYAASKGGLVNLTRSLAAQWAPHGIRVNALAPGWFHSEMTADMFDDPAALKWATRRTPLGRVGREDELDGALLFLASDASSFVTGHTLVVDGGWCAT